MEFKWTITNHPISLTFTAAKMSGFTVQQAFTEFYTLEDK
jgi:hypothetical protein